MKIIKIVSLILVAVMLTASLTAFASYALPAAELDVWDGSIATAFAAGKGTKADPYQIRTGAELAYLAQQVNEGKLVDKHYVLVNDIDLAGKNWKPIGNGTAKFRGYFNGNGRTVKNLVIDNGDTQYTGLFGYAFKSEMFNINLEATSVKGGNFTGALFGRLEGCDIYNCTVNAEYVSGTSWVAALCGGMYNSYVYNCFVKGGTILSSSEMCGGLFGWTTSAVDDHGYVGNCMVMCDNLVGTNYVGGAIGYTMHTDIENCCVIGNPPMFSKEGAKSYNASFGYVLDCNFSGCKYMANDIVDDPNAEPVTGTSMEELGCGKGWYQGTSVVDGYPYLPQWVQMTYPFADAPGGKWYTDAVAYCYINSYMSGVFYSLFEPDSSLTRAQFVQILAKLENVDFASIKYTDVFSDIPQGEWYTNAVIWASDFGVTGGVGGGKFAPDDPVTREQLAVFYRAYAQVKGKDVSESADITGYVDIAEVSRWAIEALSWAVDKGIISGTQMNCLSPKEPSTRAQVALITKLLYENVLDA